MKMRNAAITLLTAVVLGFAYQLNAQDLPEWASKLPVEKGFVYGVGKAESSDMMMAKRMADMNAKNDLMNHYSEKFELFAVHCDTLMGPDNSIRTIVTTIHSQKEAMLTNVVVADEKMYQSASGRTTCYLLLKMDVKTEVDKLKTEVDNNAELKGKMKEKGLLKELKEM